MADRFSTLPFRLFRAIELGDAAAVRRALADGADPERGPAEEFGTGTFNLAYVQKIQKAGGIRPYEALVKKSLTAMLEPKLPQIPKEIIPTIVEFWAHAGDYCMPFCMPFGPETLVRRGLEQIAARVANGNVVVASHK